VAVDRTEIIRFLIKSTGSVILEQEHKTEVKRVKAPQALVKGDCQVPSR
jgi:hypothetical protein